MIKTRNRSTETIVYAVLWLIAIGLYLLDAMRVRAQLSEPLIDFSILGAMARTMIPFLILFLINNNLLIPRLLLKNRVLPYFILTAAAVIAIWGYQYLMFINKANMMPAHPHPAPHPYLRPLLPLPLFLDFTYALLVVGCNLAIALMFQRYDDKLENESLMKANAENQLAYLKAQINPHFYMNMLNNIHGMIEIDPDKAQTMVLEMSHLMRYMLYESSKPRITLSDETAFLRNYLNLMRQRYPANAVSITSDFPVDAAARRITLPPLLFLVFIENAFKHGISYQQPSFVSVSIKMAGDTLTFNCMNSRVAHESNRPERTGIGLRNIRQRLALLDGVSVQSMSKNQRAVTRNRKIGFVFQNYNLLPKTTAIENVELPLLYNSAVSARERRERAIAALEAVGLGSRLNHKSNQMSGGQQQRVAIARALVNDPVIILADEATGNLDTRTSFSILMLFQELHAKGRTIIFVTHNPELADYSSRNIVLRDGKVVSDTYNSASASAREAFDNLPKDND